MSGPSSIVLSVLAGLAALVVAPDTALAECTAPSGVCVRGGQRVAFQAGETLNDKQRSREAKKNRRLHPIVLHVVLDEGRGSVFIDGVWVGTAPLRGLELAPGKHDLQVRDGTLVLAAGVLDLPRDPGSDVELEVRHP